MYYVIILISLAGSMGLTMADAISITPIELGTKRQNYKVYVEDSNQIICTMPIARNIQRLWSSAYIDIKSDSKCIIHEDVNTTDYSSPRNKVSAFTIALERIKSFQFKSDEKCRQILYVPLFKKACFDIEINGLLEVNYVFTSVSFGVFGFVIILLLILLRFIPRKSTAILTFFTGSSLFWFFSRWMMYNFKSVAESFQSYIIAYILLSVVLSALYCYYKGPVTNPRLINIIEYLIKFISFMLVYSGTSHTEICIALFIGIFLANLIFKLVNFKLNIKQNRLFFKMFPPKRKLLSEDEYLREGQEYTQKALKELRDYCNSPECDSWKIVSRIQSPTRFAKFIQDETHLSDDEVYEYERYSVSNDLIDDDDAEQQSIIDSFRN